jgi:hypothetical protein
MTDDSLRNLLIDALKNKLATCERDCADLAREIVRPMTAPDRRVAALIQRAELQTTILAISHEIALLASDPDRSFDDASLYSSEIEMQTTPS